MDIFLVILGFILAIAGVFGSFLPVLPGPPLSWLAILMLHLTKAIDLSWWLLAITLFIALLITGLDYVIPSMGAKKFGGSKAGIWGTSIGLVVGIFAPFPFAVIICPFLGALIGELINNAAPRKAIKAAFGSFLGFLTGTFIKFVVSIIFLGIFLIRIWDYREIIFSNK